MLKQCTCLCVCVCVCVCECVSTQMLKAHLGAPECLCIWRRRAHYGVNEFISATPWLPHYLRSAAGSLAVGLSRREKGAPEHHADAEPSSAVRCRWGSIYDNCLHMSKLIVKLDCGRSAKAPVQDLRCKQILMELHSHCGNSTAFSAGDTNVARW